MSHSGNKLSDEKQECKPRRPNKMKELSDATPFFQKAIKKKSYGVVQRYEVTQREN